MGKEPASGTPAVPSRTKMSRVLLAALCVAGTVAAGAGIGSGYTTGYTVEYQGSPIAYVANKDALTSAVLRAEALTSDLLDTDYTFGQELQVKTSLVPRDSVTPLPETTDSLMEQVPELTRLYTLTLDGTPVGVVEKAETITRALDRVKDSFRTDATVDIAVESKIGVERSFQARDTQILDEDQLVELLSAPVTRVFPYTTREGDTMESVAKAFGMDPQRLDELNDGIDLEIAATDADIARLDEILGDTSVTGGTEGPDDSAFLPYDDFAPVGQVGSPETRALAAEAVREAYAALDASQSVTENEEELELTEAPLNPGQTIAVEQTCTRLVVTTVEEKVVERPIQPEKLTLLDSTIPMGTQKVLVDGKPGTQTVMTRVTKRCGIEVANTDVSSVSRQRAEPLLVAVGYGSHPELYDFFAVGDIMFQWPVQGSISSDYGYRHIFGGLNFHRGVDIPAPMGTAVHAAADGTVIFAGVKGSYGNLVIIDHGNGFQTLYGHNSGFLVKPGDVVTRGQSIAAVGSTGRSTGPHCHFEVHLNGELVDPLMYLPGDNNAPARLRIPLSELNQAVEEAKAQETSPASKPAETPAPVVQPSETPAQTEEPVETPADDTAQETPAEPPAETGEEPAAEPAPAEEPAAPSPATPVSDALAESLGPQEQE